MTARERLNHRLRWLAGVMTLGVVLVVAGVVAVVEIGGPTAAAIVVPGILTLMGVALTGQSFALRCPWCRGNLGVLLMRSGGFRVSPTVRYCPYCGVHLDDDRDRAAGWDDPVE